MQVRARLVRSFSLLELGPGPDAAYLIQQADSALDRMQALLREDLIAREHDRYVVVDSLMREWIARRTF